jgi:hypothetical protein
MNQRGGLERVALGFVFHVAAGHETQLGINVLRQTAQGCFVTAAPGFQQVRDLSGACVDGLPPVGCKKYAKPVAAFGGSLPPVPVEGEQSVTMISFRKQEAQMKYIPTMALMLSLSVASGYAQQHQVKMVLSGTAASSTINLQQPNTNNNEDNFAGNGTLGSFTFRNVRAIANSPTPSSTCSGPNQFHFSSDVGAGVFRFQDGSLLKVNLTHGDDCIDLAAQEAHCALTFQITGGTGRFKNASGVLSFTETVSPVLADASNNPVFFASTGEFTGTVSGVSREQGKEEQGQGEEQ